MDDSTKAEYEAKCQALRVDLKTFESAWAKDNGGKKPGRADIKQNPDIAQKYKQYQKCRDILDGKAPPPSDQSQHQPPKKRKAAPAATPSKRSRHAETPSKNHFTQEHLEETPTISRKLFSPSAITSLGPTPQRDGRVLGLFDLLDETNAVASPSRAANSGQGNGKVQSTPSKRAAASDVESTPRMGRTPMSASKRQYLNTFLSPLKNRDANAANINSGIGSLLGNRTPSKGSSALHFDTPQFLKRHTNLTTVDENGEADSLSAPPLRLPRKPMGRGLSEIVASLRQVEEEKADEDLEALRAMEADEMGHPMPSRPETQSKNVEVGDSQIPRLPLGGFDDEAMYDSPAEDEAKGADGNPLRVYKKKGQKRTTRKVNIKPTWIKRPDAPAPVQDDSDDEDVVPKTQLDGDPSGDANYDVSSDSEFDDASEKKKTQSKKRKKPAQAEKQQKDGPVKKAARKVNELAHANFHRLKLRQNGAKGGPGHNSRFRRRR